MTRKIFISLILFAIFLHSNLFGADINISIMQDNKNIQVKNGQYPLISQPFDIYINNLNREIVAQIFIYQTDFFSETYELPIEANSTEMFSPGTGMGAMVDPETKELELYTGPKGGHNYIYEDRRINNDDGAIIKVIKIRNVTDPETKPETAYLTIFTDLNKNRIIETDELQILLLKIKNY